MPEAAVFIDGGYLSKILKTLGEPRIDYRKLARWAASDFDLFRTYYYDCASYQSAQPTEDEKRRASARQSFLNALNRHERFTVRLGRLAYRGKDEQGAPIFEQKRVDLMLAFDVAALVAKARVRLVNRSQLTSKSSGTNQMSDTKSPRKFLLPCFLVRRGNEMRRPPRRTASPG